MISLRSIPGRINCEDKTLPQAGQHLLRDAEEKRSKEVKSLLPPACLSLLAGKWSHSVADAAAIMVPSMNDVSLQFLWSPNRMTIYHPGTCWAFSTELGLLRHPLSGPEEKLLGPQPPVTQTAIVGVPRSNYTSNASKSPSLSVSLSRMYVF